MNITYPDPSPTADTVLGSIYTACSLLGVPANIAALYFFSRQRAHTLRRTSSHSVLREHTLLFNTIYIAIVLSDLLITATVFPVAEGFFSGREPTLFGTPLFCSIWGFLWNILPFYSVFLVFVMSVTRTVILLKPKARLDKTRVLGLMLGYLALLCARVISALFLDDVNYMYTANDQYCWEDRISEPWYEKVQIYLEGILLALPILPILFSCLLSVYLLTSNPGVKSPRRTTKLHRHASVTVVMVTMVYLVLNFPNFLNFVVYIGLRLRGEAMIDVYNSSFLWNYSWNVTYVLCVTVNACLNPAVYLLRIQGYRTEVVRTGRVIRNSVAEMFASTSLAVNRTAVGSILEEEADGGRADEEVNPTVCEEVAKQRVASSNPVLRPSVGTFLHGVACSLHGIVNSVGIDPVSTNSSIAADPNTSFEVESHVADDCLVIENKL